MISEYLIYKNNKKNILSKLKNYNICYFIIILFIIGIIIHLLLEYIGLNKWQCNKICDNNKCKYICIK